MFCTIKTKIQERANMKNIPISKARTDLREIINKVSYGKDRIYLTSYGKPLAAIISIDDMEKFKEYEKKVLIIKN